MEQLFALLAQWWQSVVPLFVVWPYEEAVHLSRGHLVRQVGPGLFWKWPIIDMVLKVNVKPSPATMQAQSLVTADGVDVVVMARLRWSVRDTTKYLLEVEDGDTVLSEAAYGVVTEKVSGAKWSELRTEEFREECYKAARKRAFALGVSIDALYFSDVSRTQSLRLITTEAVQVAE